MKKIHLVGFSIGSLIARNFATKYNDRLESLTLLCSIFNRSQEQQQIVKDRFELVKKSKTLSKGERCSTSLLLYFKRIL